MPSELPKMVSSNQENTLVIETQHRHGVVQLTLNRPHVLNALNAELYYAMAAALRKHNSLPSTRLIILTGAGKRSFCGGMDVKEAAEPGQARRTIRAARAFIDALLRCDKPVVAAVFGSVTGIGVTLLVHCDRVYSASDATFQTPFAEVGIVPEFGSSALFPQMLGLRLANALLLRGVSVGAEEMARAGLVEVVQSEEKDIVVQAAVEGSERWSSRLGYGEQWRGVVESKRLVRTPIRRQVLKAMEAEFSVIEKQIESGDTEKMIAMKVAEISKRNSKL